MYKSLSSDNVTSFALNLNSSYLEYRIILTI